ncbi:hypothetical protein T552_01095 [Pneumocystis carinii B80]|uniref:Type 1 phosphatases regulator n=1 Tax=Pneumocystis carinii (strain B80) TaxID=1408658 RepID=A0A0W4ZNE3_PNEC8|nr:hypothetical protein T552_01095 [Pneumocystis carinii B80]KTW29892.1 hypothetical protein T552_01095 [Pneumocystis carinii B80]
MHQQNLFSRNRSEVSQSITDPLVFQSSFTSDQNNEVTGIIRLTGASSERRVRFDETAIDNEGMGKKKSKICCIYHKPREYDESSSSDTDSSSGSENYKNLHANNHTCFHEDTPVNSGKLKLFDKTTRHLNAYETYPKTRKIS